MRLIPGTSRSVHAFLSAAFLLASVACKSDDSRSSTAPASGRERAEITNEYTATAAVVAVQAEGRVVTLRREDGTTFDVQAGPAVRNFDQIAVGDELRVRFNESLVATKLSPGEAARPAEAALAGARTPAGAKPGAGVGMSVSLRVKIESIDRERDIVVFSLSSGELIAHRLETDEGRDFASSLEVGDMVQLDHMEVLALTVEEL
jgi:hypothetical protein